jgi:RNA polymerase sigma factor (sigma-70 family)
MSSTEPATPIEALLAERPWLRRLACALTRDGHAAEDLFQETWVTALTAPPKTTTRAWLRRVLLSRLYDDSRTRRRRQLREQAVFESSADQVATPEEITGRVEMLRSVADHMLSLDENVRQILYMRYVEDLEPIEVARRLGIPDGTVRWRMKQGLDHLRAQLDADTQGERRRWRALLAPLGALEQPSPPARQRLSWAGGLATMVGFMAVGLALASWRCSTATPGDTAARAADPAPGPATERQAVAPLASLPDGGEPQVAANPTPPCPEAEAMELELSALAKATEKVRTPARDVFLQAAPNATIDQQLVAAVDELFEKPGRCGHSFECRGQVCRVSLMVPEAITKLNGWSTFECYDADVWERVQPRFWGLPSYDYGGSTFDPVSKTGFVRVDVYYRLFDERAAPASPEDGHAIKLPAGWDRDRGPVPAKLPLVCRDRLLILRRKMAVLVRQITRNMDVGLVFEQSTARPELTRELVGLLRPRLAAEGKPLPVDVECRGTVCALKPRQDVAAAAVRWKCMPNGKPGGSSCWGRWDDDGWFAQLVKSYSQLPLENLVSPREYEGVTLPAFIVLQPRNEVQAISVDRWVRHLIRASDYPGIVAACEKRHPAKGSLTVLAKVPETCGLAEKPNESPITVQYGGELMNSALANCLRMATDQVLSRVEPPGCTFAWLSEWRLDFPHPKIEIDTSDEN